MAVDYVSYSGKSNVGFNMKTNEDYILFNESDFGDCLFTSIADGSGAKMALFVHLPLQYIKPKHF